MTRGKQLMWKLMLAFFLTCAIGSLLAWGILLTTVCATPHTHVADAQHTIAYSCHGLTVFMSSLEEALHQWLIPAGLLFTALSVIAATMVALSTVKVKFKVEVRITDAPESQDTPTKSGP